MTPGSDAERNRDAFNARQVVEDYRRTSGLTEAEAYLLGRHLRPGMAVLDLGVGTGRTVEPLAATAARYVGLDYAPQMIEAARSAHPGRELLVADASDLGRFGDADFDVVVFSYNGLDYLHPADQRRRCLAEMRRVLRTGGRLLFSTHNARALLRRPNPELGPRRYPVAAYQSLRRIAERLPQPAFRSGDGYVVDRVRGGLTTHVAVPSAVISETEAFGFGHLETAPGDHPRHGRSLVTPWWYYAFEAR